MMTGTGPVVAPDQIIFVLGDFRGDVSIRKFEWKNPTLHFATALILFWGVPCFFPARSRRSRTYGSSLPPRAEPCGMTVPSPHSSLVPTTQMLFGSDHPFIPLAETTERVMKLGFSATDLQRIVCDNALSLLPRLKPR